MNELTEVVESMQEHDTWGQLMELVRGYSKPTPKKIIYVGDKTIVLWSDDTKTEVKCVPGEQFSQEGGFAACLVKKMFPNRSQLLRMIDEKKEVREPKKRKDYELLDKNS